MVKDLIVNLLNRLTGSSGDGNFEWTNPKIALVLFVWIWGIIGVGIAVYGIVRYEFQKHDEDFYLIPIGIGATVAGNLAAVIVGKILNRKR